MAFVNQYDLAKNNEFIKRVCQAMVTAATQVASEDPSTPGHYERLQWAVQVLRDPETYASKMAFGVASNPVIILASTDNDIQFTVNSLWNAYSGVSSK